MVICDLKWFKWGKDAFASHKWNTVEDMFDDFARRGSGRPVGLAEEAYRAGWQQGAAEKKWEREYQETRKKERAEARKCQRG